MQRRDNHRSGGGRPNQTGQQRHQGRGGKRGGSVGGAAGQKAAGKPGVAGRPQAPRMVSRAGVPAEFADASRGERLQKVLAAAGVASRRDCEKLIEQGAVTVNGQRVSALPAWVDPARDKVCVDGQPIKRASHGKGWGRDGGHDLVYLAVHKPRGVIATTSDDLGRRNVLDLIELPRSVDVMLPRLFPVGRLDADSTGLILLTNDGDLANKLTHPRYQIPKEYEATVKGRLNQDDVQRLRDGLFSAGRRGRAGKGEEDMPGDVSIRGLRREDQADGERGDRTVLAITLREGPMREIQQLMEHLGYKVNRLKRIAIGPIRLKGLGAGKWRALSPNEIALLRAAVAEASRAAKE